MNILITILVATISAVIIFGLIESYYIYNRCIEEGPQTYRTETKIDKVTGKYYSLRYPVYIDKASKLSFEGTPIRQD